MNDFTSFCTGYLSISFDGCGGFVRYDDFPVYQNRFTGKLIQAEDDNHAHILRNARKENTHEYRYLEKSECLIALSAMYYMYMENKDE